MCVCGGGGDEKGYGGSRHKLPSNNHAIMCTMDTQILDVHIAQMGPRAEV